MAPTMNTLPAPRFSALPRWAHLMPLLALLGLSACGGGTGVTLELTPDREVKKLNIDNMVRAVAVAQMADQHSQVDVGQVLRPLLLDLYKTQNVAGRYPCLQGGTVTLERSGATLWRYTADNCNQGNVQVTSGSWEVDTSLAATAGVRYRLNKLLLAKFYSETPEISVTADLSFDIPSGSSFNAGGSLNFAYLGSQRDYGDLRFAGRKADGYLYNERSLSIKSTPAIGLPLKMSVSADGALTVSADDGSQVVARLEGGVYALGLRNSASGSVLVAKALSEAEMRAERIKARL